MVLGFRPLLGHRRAVGLRRGAVGRIIMRHLGLLSVLPQVIIHAGVLFLKRMELRLLPEVFLMFFPSTAVLFMVGP